VKGVRPISTEGIDKIRFNDMRELPGRFETTGAVLGAVADIVRYNRGDDYVQTLRGRIQKQDDEAIRAAAREVIKPDAFTWVVVGDLAKIESAVRALNVGEVKVIDAEGKVLR